MSENSPVREQEEPRGLVCPKCGRGDLRVLYTRYRPNRIVWVRKCGGCKQRVVTHEAIGVWQLVDDNDPGVERQDIGRAFAWPESARGRLPGVTNS